MSLRTSLRPLASALRPICAPSPARALPLLANSVSTPRYTSSTSTSSHLPTGTTRDPAHPHLYYHLLPTPAAPESIALSFLPSYPLPSSSTIIGLLPAKAGAGLHDFRENPGFREVLSAAIKEGLEKKVDGGLEYEAEMRPGDGYMTLTGECRRQRGLGLSEEKGAGGEGRGGVGAQEEDEGVGE